MKKLKILILCIGNSCRSQMAHGFLQSFDDKSLYAQRYRTCQTDKSKSSPGYEGSWY
jgi:arsenate reductase